MEAAARRRSGLPRAQETVVFVVLVCGGGKGSRGGARRARESPLLEEPAPRTGGWRGPALGGTCPAAQSSRWSPGLQATLASPPAASPAGSWSRGLKNVGQRCRHRPQASGPQRADPQGGPGLGRGSLGVAAAFRFWEARGQSEVWGRVGGARGGGGRAGPEDLLGFCSPEPLPTPRRPTLSLAPPPAHFPREGKMWLWPPAVRPWGGH